MPDRPNVIFQTKRDSGVYAVRRGSWFPSVTGTRDEVTPEENPTSLKKAKLESAQW